ncbi:MAG: ATP synthase F1 subunit gamma [Muribaculaceae bacterium]|nr:ATP synthase F1 subunit gamma [Muribaculaceae bacterium]
MATLRELKGRIGSVASSEKITGAMKMISSAKMHKAEGALRRLQPYRSQVETVISSLLGSDAMFESPLIEKRDVKNCAIVIWGSDDGLCGAYNANLAKLIPESVKKIKDSCGNDVHIKIFTVGSKMFKAARKYSSAEVEIQPITSVSSKSEGSDLKNFLNEMIEKFVSGEFDRVDVLYMNFISASRQRSVFSTLLPVESGEFKGVDSKNQSKPYIFEPDAKSIFDKVVPMYLLAVTEDIFTENRASEQAARVMAMQSANDNAKKLLEQLRLEYNKLRQQAITNELLDIVGGQIR